MLLINGRRLIPAPFLSISQQYSSTPDGRALGSIYALQLRGTLLPNQGSPFTTGWHTSTTSEPSSQSDIVTTEQNHEALLRKQELLREAFSASDASGVYLNYFSSGYQSVEAFCRPRSISFEPNTWVQTCDYSIELDTLYLNKLDTSGVNDLFQLSSSGLGLRSIQDSWQIAQRDDDVSRYLITRTVSAQADTVYGATGIWGGEAWRNARAWVAGRISGYGMEANAFGLPTGFNGYSNLTVDETVDKTAGSYSIVQRYAYGASEITENRTVQRSIAYRLINDNSTPFVENITVNGTIIGYPTGITGAGTPASFNASGSVAKAYSYWNSIKDLIGPSVGAFGSGTTINLTEDYAAGSLAYTINFINSSGSTYKHVYDVSYTLDQGGFPVVSINGNIEGITVDGWAGPSNTLRMNSAVSGWRDVIQPSLKSLAFAYPNGAIFPTGITSSNFNNVPLNQSVSFNTANGTIQYSAAYGYLDGGSASNLYRNEYTINYSTSNGIGVGGGHIVSATVDGTIFGLSSGTPDQRITNASNAFSTIESGIYALASGGVSTYFTDTPGLINRPLTKSVVVNRPQGALNYSYTYSNALQASGTSVAVAEVSVEETMPASILAVQTIPGRSQGPIIQNIGTKTESRRNISINLIMSSKGGTDRWAFADRSTARDAASGYLNSVTTDWGVYNTDWFIVGENPVWDWKNGVYNVTYQVLKASGG